MADTTDTPIKKEPWEDRFLELMERDGNVTRAAKGARVARKTVYRHRDARAEFAKDWAEAEKLGGEALEDECRRRGFEGSDTLLIFLTKAHKPEKYREETLTPKKFVALFEHLLEVMKAEVGETHARRVAQRFQLEAAGVLINGHSLPTVDRGTDSEP